MNTLIYHIFNSNKKVCKWNIDQIRKRQHLFQMCYFKIASINERQTRRLIDSELSGLQEGSEVIVYKNDRKLGEGVGFIELLEKSISDDPGGYTFYAHTKGSSISWMNRKYKYLKYILPWNEAMYRLNLDYPEKLKMLWGKGYKSIGALMRIEEHEGSNWHFPGSFYWLNNRAVLETTNWKQKADSRYITESFPGRLFRTNEVYSLYTPSVIKNIYREGLDPGELYEAYDRLAESETILMSHDGDKSLAFRRKLEY
jgi:hypothetical protein